MIKVAGNAKGTSEIVESILCLQNHDSLSNQGIL